MKVFLSEVPYPFEGQYWRKMRKSILLILMLTSLNLLAQEEKESVPFFAGFYGAYAIQPGVKLGTIFNIRKWQKDEGVDLKSRSVFVSPQVGVFVRPKNHTSFVLNVDMGYNIGGAKSQTYLAPAIGLGYLASNQRLSATVDLSSGGVSDTSNELRHYFLPTVSFEFGKAAKDKIGWYSKFSFGRKVSSRLENSAFFAIELGMKFMVNRKT